jgi:hypothetical protein
MDTKRDDVDLLNKLEGKSPVHAAVQGRKRSKILIFFFYFSIYSPL